MVSNFSQYYLTMIKEKNFLMVNNLYLRLYKSGFAVFKDYPFFGVGNKKL